MTPEQHLTRRRNRRRLLTYLRRGGVVVREQFKGAVGEQWRRATRCGQGFDATACARLLERGCVLGGVKYELVRVENSEAAFALAEAG